MTRIENSELLKKSTSGLGAFVITRNEERCIERCIESLQGHVDQLVVLDTGSSDKTVELAKELGAEVYEMDWRDDFSLARNKAISHLRTDWFLSLDADEWVDTGSWSGLRDRLCAFDLKGIPRAWIWMHNYTDEGLSRERMVRLASRRKAKYEGLVHEQIVVGDDVSKAVASSGIQIHHDGYLLKYQREKNKVARNISLLAHALEEQPKDLYLQYQYLYTLWQAQPSEGLLEKLLQLWTLHEQEHVREAVWGEYVPGGIRETVYALIANRQIESALKLIKNWLPRFNDHPGLHFVHGIVRMHLEHWTAMVEAFYRCLCIGETDAYSTVAGVGTYRPHFNLGLHAEVQGQCSKAEMHYLQALQYKPDFKQARDGLQRLSRLKAG